MFVVINNKLERRLGKQQLEFKSDFWFDPVENHEDSIGDNNDNILLNAWSVQNSPE
jgi:hypothetical protein